MKKHKSASPPSPSAADLFRKAWDEENDRERRTKEMARQVLAVASRFAGDGPIVVVGAGICYATLADDRPCVHCGKSTPAVAVFRPTEGFCRQVLGVPPATAVAVISTLCDNCVNLCMRGGKTCEAIEAEVMAIISE